MGVAALLSASPTKQVSIPAPASLRHYCHAYYLDMSHFNFPRLTLTGWFWLDIRTTFVLSRQYWRYNMPDIWRLGPFIYTHYKLAFICLVGARSINVILI